jgi:uncharacterized protein YndB with AHSA1/START domain
MLATSIQAQTGRATTVKTRFHRETTVSIDIQADSSTVWALLTKASDYPRWNSTVTAIEGRIAPGETIRLKSKLDAKRVFKLKIKTFEPDHLLIWGDGQGQRKFTLEKKQDGMLRFTMSERIGGLLFPLYAKMIPSFDQSFEQFAADLKKESELILKSN